MEKILKNNLLYSTMDNRKGDSTENDNLSG